ncbi:hypothetical protein CCE01nite_05630 [Cellulomonas cellasea]|nr:hypothetical protein CCE01nite_05630 [Cellulomonas cellasea]
MVAVAAVAARPVDGARAGAGARRPRLTGTTRTTHGRRGAGARGRGGATIVTDGAGRPVPARRHGEAPHDGGRRRVPSRTAGRATQGVHTMSSTRSTTGTARSHLTVDHEPAASGARVPALLP